MNLRVPWKMKEYTEYLRNYYVQILKKGTTSHSWLKNRCSNTSRGTDISRRHSAPTRSLAHTSYLDAILLTLFIHWVQKSSVLRTTHILKSDWQFTLFIAAMRATWTTLTPVRRQYTLHNLHQHFVTSCFPVPDAVAVTLLSQYLRPPAIQQCNLIPISTWTYYQCISIEFPRLLLSSIRS
jgi:hypothetical protein